MEFIDNLRYIKNNWKPYQEWDIEQQKNEARNNELRKKLNLTPKEKEYAKNCGNTLISAIDTMDQISINKSENANIAINSALSMATLTIMMLGAEVGYLMSELSKNKNKTPKIAAFIGYVATGIVSITAMRFISAHFDKMATRIARYQIRENELRDTRNFVVYTDEQIEQAKKIAKTIPEVKDVTIDTDFKGSFNPITTYKRAFKTVKELKRDYADYKNWHDKYLEQEAQKPEKFAEMNVSEEEIEQAEKDRDKILDTVKKLELSSNEYEMNVRLAGTAAMLLIDSFGLLAGMFGCWGLGRLAAKNAKSSKLSVVLDYMSKAAFPAGFLLPALVSGPLVKIRKESSRIGRYKQKEALRSDGENFVTFSDKQKQNADITGFKEKKELSFFQQLKVDLKNISALKKDFSDYQKYKNNERQNELKLREALKKIEITPEQKAEAEKLQKQMFMAFEEIDNKAESFIDDTSAASASIFSVVSAIVNNICNLSVILLFGKKLSKYTDGNRMPGFFEALKLSKNLTLKELALIFVLPMAISKIIVSGAISTLRVQINKKACKIGIMSAMKDLEDPKNFVSAKQESKPESSNLIDNFIRNKFVREGGVNKN